MVYLLALVILMVFGALLWNLVHSCVKVFVWTVAKSGVPHEVQEAKDTIVIWLAGTALVSLIWWSV